MNKKHGLLILFLVFFTSSPAIAFDHHHGMFDIVLKKHVLMKDGGQSSQVDYKGIANDKALFKTYLAELSSVKKKEFDSWNRNRRLAFLINAYNAYTIALVLDHYPVKSIRDIGTLFKSPWSIPFVPLFGEKLSLDHIEHTMIRQKGAYDEPRIHVALVCASVGCPALLNEAYTAENLESQLEKALVSFLSDKSRNRYDPRDNKLHVSSLFKWYEKDFKDKYGTLFNFFIRYKDNLGFTKDHMTAKRRATKIVFEDYNWDLNDR